MRLAVLELSPIKSCPKPERKPRRLAGHCETPLKLPSCPRETHPLTRNEGEQIMIKTSSKLGLILGAVVALPALAQSMSPTETYLAFRAAYQDAKSFGDVAPFYSEETLKDIPADEKEFIFEFMQGIMKDGTRFKVLSENTEGNQATVVAEFCLEGDMSGAEVPMVKDAGQWKIEQINFSNDNHMVPDPNDPEMMVTMKCE
jgi:hypothetical protein